MLNGIKTNIFRKLVLVFFMLILIVVGLGGVTETALSAYVPADEIEKSEIEGSCVQKTELNYNCPPTTCTPGRDVDSTFMEGVLTRLSINPANFAVQMLMAWEPYENTLACWNPLATTRKMEYICNFNSVGVQHYQDKDMGMRATAQTLALSYYTSIRAMLSGQTFDREAIRTALGTWGTCSGTGCDPLLNSWQTLFNSQQPPVDPGPGEIYLETPNLVPAAGPTCSTGWYELTNDRGHPFYLTLNTNQQNQSTNSATWTPNLTFTGKWRVEAYVAYHPIINWPCPPYTRAIWDTSDARYTITHAGGSYEVPGNQAPLNNQWLNLGEFQFNAGTSGSVRLVDLNGEENLTKTIQFGAMRFILLTPHGPATSLMASDGTYTDKVLINWNSVVGATNYQVYRAEAATGTKTQLGTVSNTTYSDTNVVQNKNYWYWVKACNASGCADFSNGDSGFAYLPIPNAPTNLTASDGDFTDKVQLTWISVSGATSYKVYRADSESGLKSQLGTVTTNSFSDSSVIQGATYWYWVTACNSSGCSDYSLGDSGYSQIPIPVPPTGLQASDGAFDDKIQLNWNTSSNATSYQIYKSNSESGTRSLIANVNTNSYNDLEFAAGTTYWYWVKACNATGCSEYSTGDSGYARIPIPSIPTGVTASDGSYSDRIMITWDLISDSTVYQVFRAESETGNKVQIGTPVSNSYSDINVISGITYWYWIKACNSSGCSDFSNSDSGYIFVQLPDIPTGVQATDGAFADKVQVTWQTSLSATTYNVYRAISQTGTRGLVGTSSTLTFDDLNVSPGTIYWYWVKACNGQNCSDFSQPDSGFASQASLSAPENVLASDGEFFDLIKIEWDTVTGATSYNIYRALNETGNKQYISSTQSNEYLDHSITDTNYYWYWVKACNTSGCSDFSMGDRGYLKEPVPKPPELVSASDGTFADQIYVDWNTVSGANEYFVYRATSQTGNKQLLYNSNNISYSDFNVETNVLYWYWVKACNDSGCGDYSAPDSGYRAAVVYKLYLPLIIK